MKTITYNPETHVLVPREPSEEMIKAGKDVFCDPSDHSEEAASNDYRNVFKGMIAAAPQPEQVESEPVTWCLAYYDPNLKLRIHSNPTLCEAESDAHVKGLNGALSKAPLYTTPQPDRTAELEAAVDKLKDALFDVLIQDMSRDKALAKINEVLKP